MEDKQQRRGGGIGDGIRSGLGVLNAFREAIEETFQEAVRRGDLSPERAGEAARAAMQRAQQGFDEARGRLDFVSRAEYEALRTAVEELRDRLDRLESPAPDEPDARSDIPVSG